MHQLKITNLTKSFDRQIVIKDASFTFEQGKIYGLLGRNGAGKTNLFNCISYDESCDQGTIKMINDHAEEISYDPMDVSFVHTEPTLPGFMTGYEFVKYFLEINRDRINGAMDVDYYLQLAGITGDDQHKLLRDYSQGMKTKVQLVTAMMIQAKILLLDEPLTAVDVVAADEMKKLIRAYKQDAVVIFSTHIMELAQDMSDEIVLLHEHQFETIPNADIHSKAFEQEVIDRLTQEVTADGQS